MSDALRCERILQNGYNKKFEAFFLLFFIVQLDNVTKISHYHIYAMYTQIKHAFQFQSQDETVPFGQLKSLT